MIFIESQIFTADVTDLLNDAKYAALQVHLPALPEAGDLMPGPAGCERFDGL